MTGPELQSLRDLLEAINDVSVGVGEARDLMGDVPASIEEMRNFSVIQRTASRAFLKGIEQLQDLLARAIRLVLILEQEDITGLSARALADRAESIGLIGSSDSWSALVKLRNQLVHEYPLSKAQQLRRLRDAWSAHIALYAVVAAISEFLRENGYPDGTAE